MHCLLISYDRRVPPNTSNGYIIWTDQTCKFTSCAPVRPDEVPCTCITRLYLSPVSVSQPSPDSYLRGPPQNRLSSLMRSAARSPNAYTTACGCAAGMYGWPKGRVSDFTKHIRIKHSLRKRSHRRPAAPSCPSPSSPGRRRSPNHHWAHSLPSSPSPSGAKSSTPAPSPTYPPPRRPAGPPPRSPPPAQ